MYKLSFNVIYRLVRLKFKVDVLFDKYENIIILLNYSDKNQGNYVYK